jgi:hypothetical protein
MLFSDLLLKITSLNTKALKLRKSNTQNSPWISSAVLRCIKTRDKLHKKLKKEPDNDIIKITYSRYRNFCTNVTRKAKRQYHKENILKSKNNTKNLWKAIKDITNFNNQKSFPRELLNFESDPLRALNRVNDFFANVDKALAEGFPSNTGPIESHCISTSAPYLKSFVLLESSA